MLYRNITNEYTGTINSKSGVLYALITSMAKPLSFIRGDDFIYPEKEVFNSEPR